MSGAYSGPVLELVNVKKSFIARRSLGPFGYTVVPAVDDVSLQVDRGETVALVGESGCGKSTLARLILHLHRPDSGKIVLVGHEVHHLPERRFRNYRRNVQMVFQNPRSSFDPLRTIGSSIGDVLSLSPSGNETTKERIARLLTEVGLSPRFAALRPQSVSGGELQRAAIARAIATYPDLVVLDEPTSALDMSIQGQILALLQALQARMKLSYLLVTHDLRMVRMVAHRIVVMYLGQIVETATVEELFGHPLHPYTAALLDASELGSPSKTGRARVSLSGTLQVPARDYAGCRLVERCPFAVEDCRRPQYLVEVSPDHWSRCWRSGNSFTYDSSSPAWFEPKPTRPQPAPKPLDEPSSVS